MSKALIVRNTIKLSADVKRVWEALTRPELTKKYMFGCEIVTDWKAGGPVLWKAMSDGQDMIYVRGRLVNMIPRRRLEYTVLGTGPDYEDIPSNYTTVTYELSPAGGQTVLAVSQGDFMTVQSGQKRYSEAVEAWDGVLKDLAALLNKPQRP